MKRKWRPKTGTSIRAARTAFLQILWMDCYFKGTIRCQCACRNINIQFLLCGAVEFAIQKTFVWIASSVTGKACSTKAVGEWGTNDGRSHDDREEWRAGFRRRWLTLRRGRPVRWSLVVRVEEGWASDEHWHASTNHGETVQRDEYRRGEWLRREEDV